MFFLIRGIYTHTNFFNVYLLHCPVNSLQQFVTFKFITFLFFLVFHQGLQEVPEAFPTFSDGQIGLPLQKIPVKPHGFVSETFFHSSDPFRVTENTSFVTRNRHKLNQQDSKIVADSTISATSAFEKLANANSSRRIQLHYVKSRNHEKFPYQSLSEYDKTGRQLSDNETNNYNLQQADFNFGKMLHSQENAIQNPILRNEENENMLPPFKYIRLVRLEDDSWWKNRLRGTNHVHQKKHIEATSNDEMDTADRTDDTRELDEIFPQGQENALNSKGSLSKLFLGNNFPKIPGSQLYVNIKRFILDSKAHMDIARGQSRIRRAFHFDYDDQDVNDIPQAPPGTSDSRTILGDTPLMNVEKPYLIDPSFDSTVLNEFASLKLRILSERLTSPRRHASGEYQFDTPPFGIIDVNSSPPGPQKLRIKPSDLLSRIRNLPTFDQDQVVAKHKFDAAFDNPELQSSQNQLGKHDFNFPDTDYLPENYPAQTKRNFDSIGEGALSGMKQNHVGKRYDGLFSTRSDSSRNGDIHPVGIYVQPDVTWKTTLDTLNNAIENSQCDNLRNSVTESTLNSFYDTTKRSRGPINKYESVNDRIVEAFGQHFKTNKELDYLKSMTTGDKSVNFPEKRLDAISNGALGGMRQNFLDKKHVQSHPKESLPELLKNFLPNKYPRETGSGANGEYSKNVVSKTKFNKFTPPRTRWRLNVNYENGRTISQSYMKANSKSKYIFAKKRNNNLIFSSYADRIKKKLLEQEQVPDNKREPDSFSANTLNDLSQIYIEQNNINSHKALSKLYDLYIHLLTQKDFALGENQFVNSLNNVGIYPSAGFKSGDQLRVVHKRDPVTLEDSEFSADYLASRNKSHASHPVEKVTPFFTTFIEAGPKANRRSVGSISENGLQEAEENLPNMDKDFPDKRSLDAIESISPISGLAQNFIETTKAQRQRIRFTPWSKYSKRSLDMYSSAVNEEKDTDNRYRHYLDVLSAGFSPRTSADVGNLQGYDRNLLFTDRTRLNPFLNKIQKSSKYIFHDLDTNERVNEFKDDDEPLHFSDTLENHNSGNQEMAAEMNGMLRHNNRK